MKELHADRVNDGSEDAGEEEGQNDILPAQDQASRSHQLHIAPSDAGAAGDEENDEKGHRNRCASDQVQKKVVQVRDNPQGTQTSDKDVQADRNFLRAGVDETQGNQGTHKAEAYKGIPGQAFEEVYSHPGETVCRLNQGVLGRQACTALPAFATLQDEAQHRYELIPGEPVPAGHAVRWTFYDALPLRHPEDNHIQKAAHADAEEEGADGKVDFHTNQLYQIIYLGSDQFSTFPLDPNTSFVVFPIYF